MTGNRRLLLLSLGVVVIVTSLVGSGQLQADSVIRQLTTDPATDVRPIWSPDGQYIAYQSNRNGNYSIWIMEADGTNQQEVTPGTSDDRHPAWSPDGQQLAFDSDASGSREIWIVDRDGQNLRQVTTLGAISSFPGWSPDGRELAFYLYQEGRMNLWAVELESNTPRPLTSDLADERRNQCTFACHQAGWSPDGQRLAYTGGDQRSIWMINADGSNPTELVSGQAENNHFPWYTADGRVGYLTEHITAAESWTDAWLLNPANGEVTLLLGRIQHQGPLAWSPDGTKVLFHSPRSGNFDVYLVDLALEGGAEALQGKADALLPPASPASEHPQEIPLASTATEAGGEEAEPPAAPEPAGPASSLPLSLVVGGLGVAGLLAVIITVIWRRKLRV